MAGVWEDGRGERGGARRARRKAKAIFEPATKSAGLRFLHPTLRKSAKDGAPGVLGWVKGVRSFASANDTPPYRKVRERVGHPVWWLGREWRSGGKGSV
jgi:hypothetical protein